MSNASGRFEQWEVWTVVWPFENGQKMDRFALLFSPNTYNQTGEPLYFMKISTQDHQNAKSRIPVSLTDPVFAGCGLPRSSFIYPQKVKKIPPSDVLRYWGRIEKEAQELVTKEVMRVVGLPPCGPCGNSTP